MTAQKWLGWASKMKKMVEQCNMEIGEKWFVHSILNMSTRGPIQHWRYSRNEAEFASHFLLPLLPVPNSASTAANFPWRFSSADLICASKLVFKSANCSVNWASIRRRNSRWPGGKSLAATSAEKEREKRSQHQITTSPATMSITMITVKQLQ